MPYIIEVWEDFGDNRIIKCKNKNEVINYLASMIGDIEITQV